MPYKEIFPKNVELNKISSWAFVTIMPKLLLWGKRIHCQCFTDWESCSQVHCFMPRRKLEELSPLSAPAPTRAPSTLFLQENLQCSLAKKARKVNPGRAFMSIEKKNTIQERLINNYRVIKGKSITGTPVLRQDRPVVWLPSTKVMHRDQNSAPKARSCCYLITQKPHFFN